jgi:hypothetical protein
VPGLLAGVALRTAALEIDGHGEQASTPPAGHGGDELAGVALGIEGTVRIGEQRSRRGIEVVEHALDHPGIQQQALDPVAAEPAPRVGRTTIDQKTIAIDVDGGPAQRDPSGSGHPGRVG